MTGSRLIVSLFVGDVYLVSSNCFVMWFSACVVRVLRRDVERELEECV